MNQYYVSWGTDEHEHGDFELIVGAVIWAKDNLDAKSRIEEQYHCKVDHVNVHRVTFPIGTPPDVVEITGSRSDSFDVGNVPNTELNFNNGESIIAKPVNMPNNT